MHALTHALRGVRKQPLFAAVVVATVALGVGINAAMFSVVHRVLLAPLPFPTASRLLQIEDRHAASATNLAYATFLEIESGPGTLEHAAAWRAWQFNVTGGAAEPQRLAGARVSRSFFATLGVAPALGRTPLAEEDVDGGAPVVTSATGCGTTVWPRGPTRSARSSC